MCLFFTLTVQVSLRFLCHPTAFFSTCWSRGTWELYIRDVLPAGHSSICHHVNLWCYELRWNSPEFYQKGKKLELLNPIISILQTVLSNPYFSASYFFTNDLFLVVCLLTDWKIDAILRERHHMAAANLALITLFS